MNEKTKYASKLEAKLNEAHIYNDNVKDVMEQLIEGYGDRLSEDNLYDFIYEITGGYFIYYSDAFNYVADYGDPDFSEAISCGCSTICSIATYQLEQAVFEELSNLL